MEGNIKSTTLFYKIWRLTLDFAWNPYLYLNQWSHTKIFLCYGSNTRATCSSYITALNKCFPRVSQDYFYIEIYCLSNILLNLDNSWKFQTPRSTGYQEKILLPQTSIKITFNTKSSKNQVLFNQWESQWKQSDYYWMLTKALFWTFLLFSEHLYQKVSFIFLKCVYKHRFVSQNSKIQSLYSNHKNTNYLILDSLNKCKPAPFTGSKWALWEKNQP